MQRSHFSDAASTKLALGAGQLYSRNFVHDAKVMAIAGTVWVTQSGKEQDVLLRAGQSLQVPAGSELVASALEGPAKLEVEVSSEAGPAGLPQRMRAALHRGA